MDSTTLANKDSINYNKEELLLQLQEYEKQLEFTIEKDAKEYLNSLMENCRSLIKNIDEYNEKKEEENEDT